jgi:hypothetical protein
MPTALICIYAVNALRMRAVALRTFAMNHHLQELVMQIEPLRTIPKLRITFYASLKIVQK